MGLLLDVTIRLLNASLMLFTIVSHKAVWVNLDLDRYMFKEINMNLSKYTVAAQNLI